MSERKRGGPRPKPRAKRAVAGAREFAVVVEEMRSHFKVFGESLEGFREQVNARFEQVNARFEQVDARFEQVNARFDEMNERSEKRFDRVDSDIALLKSAVATHGRDLKEIRAALEKKVDRDEVEPIVKRIVLSAGNAD